MLIVMLSFTYFYFEGKREAYYFHFKNKVETNYLSEHKMFLTQRILVFLMATCLNYFVINYYILYSLGLLLCFSFIHNGTYYYFRNKLDPGIYHLQFKANSTTSNAVMEFDYETRLFMFMIGLTLIVLNYII